MRKLTERLKVLEFRSFRLLVILNGDNIGKRFLKATTLYLQTERKIRIINKLLNQ